MPPELDLFAFDRGSITAPAGCGKTQLIADTIEAHTGSKPILVLTHTNAGVSALRSRFKRAGVKSSRYKVTTIDGFAIRLIGQFPTRSGHDPAILDLVNPSTDYPAIREAAWQLLRAGHVNDALRSTYSRLIVDEYQDCNILQHRIVDWAAVALPTCVLGDPMQAIFGFAGNQLVNWPTDVIPQFPARGHLQTPWRWRRADTEPLGIWLLAARQELEAGRPVNLLGAPGEVVWVQLSLATAFRQRLVAARTAAPGAQGTVLVIGDSRRADTRHQLASQTPGATTVERADLDDLTNFGRRFNLGGDDPLGQLISFSSELMTGVGAAELVRRVATLRNGRPRNPPSPVEHFAVAFAHAPSHGAAFQFLSCLPTQAGVRVYRPEVFRACLSSLQVAAHGGCTFHAATVRAREQNRYVGRPLARRAVGSTLLLKGLEADVVVVLHPDQMTAQNLYVALTRGARQVVVCSETALLTPVPQQ